ncbi:hypothetical protein ANN_11674 [Periplaneta americana]|uniref:Uncharacterized protein n=1 Tax=Periplaneta americana TaxID=6978 RepID=A0ABQ8T7F7_PERAM|nr:hypothetical protein ANN_11674 [Periplaneta americana]
MRKRGAGERNSVSKVQSTGFHAAFLPRFQNWRSDTVFQQDGTPLHYANHVCDFLADTFSHRCIGRGGPTPWPPRSPDVTPLNFFLWGFVKDKVYRNPVTDIAELSGRIYREIGLFTPEMLSRVWQEIEYHLDIALATNDAHIEHIGATTELDVALIPPVPADDLLPACRSERNHFETQHSAYTQLDTPYGSTSRFKNYRVGEKKNGAETDQEEEKEMVGSLTEKKLPTEECTRRNGEREKSSGQKKISDGNHPPYSPDFAYEEVKSVLWGRLYAQKTEFYERGVLNLVSRWEKCFERLGSHAEK